MAERDSLDILAVAAHPDDAEITCGGFLIKMARLGRRTGVADLTRGEAGTWGDETTREQEAAEAAQIMGLTLRRNLALPDAAVEADRATRLAVAQVIRDTRPELVILPHWEQRHPDHLACSRAGYDACFLAGLKKIELEGEPFRPRKIIYVSYFRNADYSFLVDVSDQFETKCRAVAAYQSQFANSPGDRIKEALKATLNVYDLIKSGGKNVFHPGLSIYDLVYTRARQLGQLAGVEFAEAYTIKEQILVDDPQKMPVRSI
jgi:bacillithiol biosynthesis deacetylase BshB1